MVNRTLMHEGNEEREFYSELPRPALVGIEAIGPMQWFLKLLDELGSNAEWETPQRFVPQNPASKNMTDATPS